MGITIAWQNVPYQEGGWDGENNKEHGEAYTRLLMPDGAHVKNEEKVGPCVFSVVGDQVSSLPGWQEGAMMSAEHVFKQITGLRKVRLAQGQVLGAPNTRRLVEGRFVRGV